MKGLIFLEMLTLYAGDLVIEYRALEGAGKGDLTALVESVTKRSLRHLIAVVILLALLLAMANAGYGSVAALLGAVIVLGWWVATAGQLGPEILALEKRLFA